MRREFALYLFSSTTAIFFLLFFATFYLAMLFWTFQKKKDKEFKEASHMALNDGEKYE